MSVPHLEQVRITGDEVISGRAAGERHQVVVVGITGKTCSGRLIGVALGDVCKQCDEDVYLIVGEVPPEPVPVQDSTQLVEQHG